MKKLALFFGALAVVPAMFASSAFADSPGQLQVSDGDFLVKNVTANSSYAKSASLKCDETVKYSFLFSNSDFGQLKDVTVKATLPNSITVSAKNADNATTSASGTVAVSQPSNGTLSYVPGTTTYYGYNADGTVASTKTLADGVTAGGINTGTLAGSTGARIYFQAKVNCATEPKMIEVCDLKTKTRITIREDQFDAAKHSKDFKDCEVVVKKIKVCELATKNIIEIDEKAYDAAKHSKNLADCAAKPPVPGEIVVCEIATKKIVTIKENAFDSKVHTKDLSKCAVVPVTPVTPTELPQTGATGVIAVVASVIAAGIGYVVTARKNVLG